MHTTPTTKTTALGAGLGRALPMPLDGNIEGVRADEDFWRQALRTAGYFELQTDYVRPAVQTTDAGRSSMVLDEELIQSLRGLALRYSTEWPLTVLTALFALLHRYSGESDIAIGHRVCARHRNGVVTDNTVVLRGDIGVNPTFALLLTRVHDTVTEAWQHARTPLNRVMEMLQSAHDPSRHPLYSICFRFDDGVASSDSAEGAPALEHDLTFVLAALTDGVHLSCEYNTDLFDTTTADGLLKHFVQLLNAAVDDPAQTVALMPMLDMAERRALTVAVNRTAAIYPEELTTPRLFELQAQRTPSALALICEDRSLSFRELDRASNQLAHELLSRGIVRGNLVGVCMTRSTDLVVALLAVLKSGAAYVPLDPAYPATRLAQIVDDAKPAAILTLRALHDRVPTTAAMKIVLDAEVEAIHRQRDSTLDPINAPRPDDLAYVIYTSGSTGRPKGVQIQHRALANLMWTMRECPGITATDTMVSVTTVSFDMSVPDLFLPLVVGAKLVFAVEAEAADGAALLRLLQWHHATIMQATPVTWQILLAAGWAGEPRLKMLCGGEAMSRTLADQLLPHGELWNMYGPTETTVWSSALRIDEGSGPIRIGPPIANTQFYVMDGQGQLAPSGAPGELYIGGNGVALGYLNLPQLTRERFVADPFSPRAGARLYRTGDRVRRRAHGTFEFLGRNDNQIKLRGFRIELGEVESVLRAHPEVAEGVAIVAPDALGENALRAYVVARDVSPDQSATLVSRLHASLRRSLPAYMCPSALMVIAAMPRTPNGKLDRAALPTPVQPSEPVPAARPRGDIEQRLTRIWCEVLGTPIISTHANFFESGGHSLLAVRLLARIETEFGQTLTLASVFKNPTLAEQTTLLADLEQNDPRAFDFRQVVKLQAHGTRPPLIGINNTGIYYGLSKRLGDDQPFTSLQLFDPSAPHAALPQTLEQIADGYVQLIQRVQPAGPYALLGWCVAGTLAFEVARQLTAAGQHVSQLLLFDTEAPGRLKRLPWFKALLADYSYRWQLIVADWSRLRSKKRWLATFLANRTIVKRLLAWLTPPPVDVAVQHRRLSAEQYDQWLLHYLEAATAAYVPKWFTGRLTLFRSSQEPAGRFIDPQMGWGMFVEKGVDVVVLEGDHFSVFQEPHVAAMASYIELLNAKPLSA